MSLQPEESIAECFAQNLRAIRKTKGLTQESLAQACGLSLVFLQNLEAGRRWVSPSTVTALAKALNVPETSFFKSCIGSASSDAKPEHQFGHLPESIRSALKLMLAGYESERSDEKRSLKKSFPGKPLKPLR